MASLAMLDARMQDEARRTQRTMIGVLIKRADRVLGARQSTRDRTLGRAACFAAT
jgi:hypothetical protein